MANVPDDTKAYFSQEELPPPPAPQSNIDIVPTGSQVTEGDLRSPNFVHDQSGWVIRSDGSAEFANIVTRVTPINIVQYTSSDIWTKPDNLKYLVVEVQAPGGAGGSTTAADRGGSGGGSGGYARKAITASVIGATATITIGSTSSFTDGTTTVTCTSGSAGTEGDAAGGAGGTATGGDININGGRGQVSQSGAGSEISGGGASSPLGVGGGPKPRSANADGEAAGGYGAGGGGAMQPGGGSQTGGAGGPGIIILTEYY